MASEFHPCPLCDDQVPCRQLKGRGRYRRITCPCCRSFLVEPTLPPRPWGGLAPEEALLAAFLPVYIRDQNRSRRVPLLTLGNWRALARRGRTVRVAQLSEAPARGVR